MAATELHSTFDVHIERLMTEFETRYSREQIEQSVRACAVQYKDARITAFIPILVYRDARSVLSGDHDATTPLPGGSDD